MRPLRICIQFYVWDIRIRGKPQLGLKLGDRTLGIWSASWETSWEPFCELTLVHGNVAPLWSFNLLRVSIGDLIAARASTWTVAASMY